jgi:hypothetical protein
MWWLWLLRIVGLSLSCLAVVRLFVGSIEPMPDAIYWPGVTAWWLAEFLDWRLPPRSY